ncbi:tetraacyldisaccharide 4'-kinase [Aurantibacter sp.]|uniref:tetraacyldisaccharide 4'-kinase n=1 Tax=Aurantibacter sp. TaxID=2807103 RepID=UPI00326348AA
MKLLRIIGLPVAFVYGLIIHMRNYLFDAGILKSKSFQTPTVCVGNLSLGGTGKTPMVEFLVEALHYHIKVAVLSRGYKRKSSGYVVADANSTVDTLGDEPFQIHKKFKQITLAVDSDRINGITTLEKTVSPSLIILDDAFQHRKVKPDFSILLTAFNNYYSDDYFLPYGTLRDSKNQAKRAQVIVVTKCPQELSLDKRMAIKERLKPLENQKVLFSFLAYNNRIKGLSKETTLDEIKNHNITLVTGIANPLPLMDYLRSKDLNFEHLRFKDHHDFSANEIRNLNSKDFVLTTEKDFVRLQGKVEELAYVEMAHQFMDDGKEQLIVELKKATKLNF